MTKFVYVTDTHIRSTTPRARRDQDYLTSVLSDLEQVLSFAETNKVDAVLHAGDFWHTPFQTERAVIETMELLYKYEIPIYVIPGQHDYSGGNQENCRTASALGILATAGLVKILTNGAKEKIGECNVFGFSYDDPETRLFLEEQDMSDNSSKVNVAVVHATLGLKSQGYKDSVEDYTPCNFNLVLYGDIHDFDTVYTHKNGCISYAVGALSKVNKDEMDRVQQFGFITVEKGKITLENVPISQLPVEQIFRTDMIAKERKYTAAGLKAALERTKNMKPESLEDKVRRIAKASDFATEVADLVIKSRNYE